MGAGASGFTLQVARELSSSPRMIANLRVVLRQLLKHPAFTLVAALTLALGIGSNTVVFSVARAVLFHSHGFESEDQLVWIRLKSSKEGVIDEELSWQDMQDLREVTRSFEAIVSYYSSDIIWEDDDQQHDLSVLRVTPGTAEILRLRPALGRMLVPADTATGEAPVTVISHELWSSRFAQSPDVLGKQVRIDGQMRSIVGVLPPGLRFPIERVHVPGPGNILRLGEHKFWLPMPVPGEQDRTSRLARMFTAFARLKPGVTEEMALAELTAVGNRLAATFPESNRHMAFRIQTLRDHVLGRARHGIPLLGAAVGAVLLICCVNLANLLLVKGAARQREIAIRLALGIERRRLIGLLMRECLLLSLLGCLAGIALAVVTLGILRNLAASSMPFVHEATVDVWVVAFAFGLSVLTAAAFGMVPAWRLSRGNAAEALHSGSRATSGPGLRRWQHGLLVGQIAVVLVLLAAAGLLLQSFYRLVGQDLGYQPHSVVTMDLATPGFPTNGDVCRMYRALYTRMSALPGVEAVGTISSVPLTRGWSFSERAQVVGRHVPEADRPSMTGTFVAFEYFETMGIPLREGRYFRNDELDDDGYGRVVLLNESASRLLFPGQSAVGGRFTVGSNPDRVLEVIGVVKDTRDVRLEEKPQPRLYWQYAFGGAQVVVRASGPVHALIPMLREIVSQTDSRVRIMNVRTMEQNIAGTVAERRFLMITVGAYSLMALAIGSIGIFGVMAYQVAQRRHEFGVRSALGASPRTLLVMVLLQAGRLALVGLGTGLGLTLVTNRLFASQLYGISSHDPLLMASVTVMILMVILVASLVPALRAANADPMVALRTE
jgi:putative ABC transport system permease protein